MVKIDIISGFLGAGKTTLIKKMINTLSDEKIVLIENEFGEIGIDGGFLKDSNIDIKEINSGCICCSLVGDFYSSLKEIIEKYSPTRIIIEPSGVGKLSDVIDAVKKVYDLNAQINIAATVVDVNKIMMYSKNFGEFYNNQIENANTIIVSRTDKADNNKIVKAFELLKNINDEANIITTPISEIDGLKLIEIMESDYNIFNKEIEEEKHHHHHDDEECECGHHHHHDDDEECECGHHHHHDDDEECECGHHHHDDDEECECGHHHHHDDDECECGHHHHHDDDECECGHHHHHHDADEVFVSIGIETVNKFNKEDLESILKKASNNENIVRLKGMVQSNNNEWFHFDLVPGEYEIRLGSPEYIGKICVIAANMTKTQLKEMFLDIK